MTEKGAALLTVLAGNDDAALIVYGDDALEKAKKMERLLGFYLSGPVETLAEPISPHLATWLKVAVGLARLHSATALGLPEDDETDVGGGA